MCVCVLQRKKPFVISGKQAQHIIVEENSISTYLLGSEGLIQFSLCVSKLMHVCGIKLRNDILEENVAIHTL